MLSRQLIAALALVPMTASAVMLNPKGLGQVLEYPYYTVNGENQTLISVVNTTDAGKALRVRFMEGENGRSVLDFNLYLGPQDVWTAAIYADDTDGAATLSTSDLSCTVPSIGSASVDFRSATYTGEASDGGSTEIARTREGHLEIIEMGEVTGSSLAAMDLYSEDSGQATTANCAQLLNAWVTGGYWQTDPETDLSLPAGGLYGSAGIVNVSEGTMFAYNAEAIDGFSSRIQHYAPGDAHPNLADAITDVEDDIATAYVPIDGSIVQLNYPASTQGIDAVSAVFMADHLYNDYTLEGSIGAQSEWLITFPTKRFYVDAELASGSLAPFEQGFGGESCISYNSHIYNREQHTNYPTVVLSPEPPTPPQYLCYETQVLTFLPTESFAAYTESPVMGSKLLYNLGGYSADSGFESGFLKLYFNYSMQLPQAGTGGDFVALNGLPVTGFLAVKYINSAVTPGVLANYSGAYPHRSSVSATQPED